MLEKVVAYPAIQRAAIKRSPWHPEQEAELIKLWTAGVYGSVIASTLGMTRNAVLGKVHRLGLMRAPRERPNLKPQKRGVRRVSRERQPPTLRFRPPPVSETIKEPLNVSIYDLGPLHCRSVAGKSPEGVTLFCGHPIDPTAKNGPSIVPYCGGHARLYYQDYRSKA